MKLKYSYPQIMNMAEYSIKEVYKMMIEEHQVVSWHGFIWSRMNTPKHGFLGWLKMVGRLQTAERFNKVGVIDDPTCLLCGSDSETHQHLFFNCPFSEVVIR